MSLNYYDYLVLKTKIQYNILIYTYYIFFIFFVRMCLKCEYYDLIIVLKFITTQQ